MKCPGIKKKSNRLVIQYECKDPYKTALVIASELIRGTDSSIDCLQRCCKEYAEKNVSKEL